MNKKPTISAHCIVKNEERFVWYAIQSVIDSVDEVLVYDTGSTDKTVEIIQTIQSPKLLFEQKGPADPARHTRLRQEMLERTKTDWVLILDGDEIWPGEQIKKLRAEIENTDKSIGIVKVYGCVGDIYHYSRRIKYSYPWGLEGPYAMRLFRSTQRLKWDAPYGRDTLLTLNGNPAVKQENCLVSDAYYLHCSALIRSGKDEEIFHRLKKRREFYVPFFHRSFSNRQPPALPEVFFSEQRPAAVKELTQFLPFMRAAANLFKHLAKKVLPCT